MPTRKKSKAAKSRRRVPRKSTRPRKVTRAARASTAGLSLQACTPSLTVNDIDKSLAWYRDVLGFKVKERWENDGELMGAELAAGRVTFYIGQDDWKKGRDRAKGEGFRVYCTTTQDIDALAARIKAARGRLAEPPHDEPWGGRALTVMDPDGFKITISKG